MTLLFAIAAGIALVIAIAGLLHYRYWVARLTVPLEYVLEERIETPDGSAIELRRLPPLRETRGGEVEPAPEKMPLAQARPPVLLVHGIAINHQNNDMLPDLSLARHLAAEGRDCWLLTLRTGRADARWRERGLMRFDRMMRHDLPIGVDRVLSRTGAARLDYVGFSMGGILLYAALGRTLAPERIRRVVILGSPAIIRPPWPLAVFGMIRFLPWWLVPTIPLRLGARLIAFAVEWFPSPARHWVYNPANVARGVAGATLMTIQDVPSALGIDFARWTALGGPIALEGETILDRLAPLDIPALFFAGAGDRIAPSDTVRAAFDAWGRDRPELEKRFVLLSSEAGASADYGHGDLVLGRSARTEVFEPIAEFLSH
jgi:polyhydroxyalkanoate synthase subunit PhaC